MGSRLQWTSDEHFTLDGNPYRAIEIPGGRNTPGQMVVLKSRRVIERYEELLSAIQPRSMFELGIHAGGSTALLAQLASPDKLVAIDILEEPVVALERFIDEHDLRDRVSTYYGVNQANVVRLGEIVQREFGENPLDLVIDDASHLLHETRSSFNALFPRLRPGGSYVIEDWSWAHQAIRLIPMFRGVPPMSTLVLELTLACARSPGVIADVSLRKGWALVHRGPAPIDRASFDVSSCLDEVGREMINAFASTRSRS